MPARAHRCASPPPKWPPKAHAPAAATSTTHRPARWEPLGRARPRPAPRPAPPTGSLVAPRPSRERRLNSSVYLGPEVLLPGYSAPAPLGACPVAPSCFPLHSPTRENGILVTRCRSLILCGGRPRSGDEPAKVVLSNPQLHKGTPFTNATDRGLAYLPKFPENSSCIRRNKKRVGKA